MPRPLTDLANLDVGAEDFLAAVLETGAQPIWVVDPQDVIRFANPPAIAALGYDRADELLGRHSHETAHYRHPDGSPYAASDCPMLLGLATGETVRSELDWFCRRDGSMFAVAYVSAPIAMPQGRGAVVSFTDIEDRRSPQPVLREHDALLAEQQPSVADIFDLSPDLLCVAGLDGYVKRVNPAFERTLGYDVADLLSRPLLELVHPDDRARTADMIAGLRETRHVSDFESRCVRADGAVRWLQWNVRVMSGRGLMYVAARDVTENRLLSQEQAALRRVATLVAQGRDAFELFDAVAGEVGRLLGADATRLLRYGQDGTAAVVGSYGAADAELGADSYDPGGLWRRIAERRVGAAAAAAAPIVVSGLPWGAIVAAWRQPEPAGAETEIRIGQFTELVATAIANAESGAELAASRRRIVTAADEARRRIGRDLHDGAQQRLVSTVLALRMAQTELGDENQPVAELLAEALANAQRGIADVRELAGGIHPRILSSGGLAPALETLARGFAVPATVVTRTQARLPEPVEVTAYYVASEALTNAAKHAQASAVRIAVEADGRWLVLRIRDDGVGGADPSRGSGLIGLRDRVEALGGALEVRSEPGAGTEMTARIPVAAPAPGEL